MKIRSHYRWLVLAPIALFVLFVAAACGDDSSSSSSSGGGSTSNATGSDEQFVSDLCKATKAAEDAVTKAITNAGADEAKIDAALGPVFSDFAASLAKTKPPKDLLSWRDDGVKALNAIADKIKKGDKSALSSGDPLPNPPKDAADRLTKVAASSADCKGVDLNLTNP